MPGRGDEIRLSGVRARGFHGVLDHERRDGQDFLVDVVMRVDLARAASSDRLEHTVHYGEVAADVVTVVEGPARDLIETVAGEIAGRVLARPPVEAVEVTVHKPEAPVGVPFGDVEVVVRRRKDVPVVLSLGANLPREDGSGGAGGGPAGLDPASTVRAAERRLRRLRGLRAVRVSALYATAPVGGAAVAGQPDYVNAVAVARTSLSPAGLLSALHRLEADLGRTRQVRWGARTLDLDLIQYGDPARRPGLDPDAVVLSEAPDLTLPHPRAHERAFVLVPWLDVDPRAALRTGGGSGRQEEEIVAVRDLIPELGEQDARRLPDAPEATPREDE